MWILLRLLLIGLRLAPTARRDLILENLALRHQLAVCARPHRPHLLDCLPEPTMGAIRIVGELRALGLDVSASSVRAYRRQALRRPPSPSWRAFLRIHAHEIWATDFLPFLR